MRRGNWNFKVALCSLSPPYRIIKKRVNEAEAPAWSANLLSCARAGQKQMQQTGVRSIALGMVERR